MQQRNPRELFGDLLCGQGNKALSIFWLYECSFWKLQDLGGFTGFRKELGVMRFFYRLLSILVFSR